MTTFGRDENVAKIFLIFFVKFVEREGLYGELE